MQKSPEQVLQSMQSVRVAVITKLVPAPRAELLADDGSAGETRAANSNKRQ